MTTLTSKEIIAEATRRQNNAAHVSQSVWVSASAGTGKTYVLTKRILQLLLADRKLQPSGILAVTFTRAAAREMESRIRERLSVWATCDENQLIEELALMLEHEPYRADIARARSLFADVLDDGVNSNTIHGFCQQILAKFPIEAGVNPGFKLVEGRERDDLLSQAKNDVFSLALNGHLKPNWIFDYYAGEVGEKTLSEALDAFVAGSGRFRRYFTRYGGLDAVLKRLADELGVDAGLTSTSVIALKKEVCKLPSGAENTLKLLMESLFQGAKTSQGLGEKLAHYLSSSERDWQELVAVFLKLDGTERKSGFPDKKALAFGGEPLWEEMEVIRARILAVQEKLKSFNAFLMTSAYLQLGDQILQKYEYLKQKVGSLDFDDLIAKSAELLRSEEKSAWVRFKMDSNISHVLLDEAQDTDSDQWGILKALVSEFYAGKGLHEEKNRTFFAVGDIKQSIYRFRGAEPHVFGAMRDYLQEHQKQSGHKVAVEELIVSFRSTEPVLNFVDCVFKDKLRGKAVDELVEIIDHRAAQIGSSGRIEIWPLIEKEKTAKEEIEAWALPTKQEKAVTIKTALAEKTALHIQQLLSSNDVLESTRNYIQPSDIMILLRSRGMMSMLIAALDKYRIPHA
ncbi:MAG: ATP-dependent helicase/nuclease subunit A, partial [bacterium]